MNQQPIANEISGRGMLARLAAIISLGGRAVWICALLYSSIVVASSASRNACAIVSVAHIWDQIESGLLLLAFALVALVMFQAVAWIIAGGDLIGFLFIYLISRSGTALMVGGAWYGISFALLKYGGTDCLRGSTPFVALFATASIIVGIIIQIGTMLLATSLYYKPKPGELT